MFVKDFYQVHGYHAHWYKSALVHRLFSRHMTGPTSASAFGRVQRRGISCFTGKEQHYLLDPATHSGVVVGLTEAGVTTSLHRLAANALAVGWKVVFIDPFGTQERAGTFTSLVRQHIPASTAIIYRQYVAPSASPSSWARAQSWNHADRAGESETPFTAGGDMSTPQAFFSLPLSSFPLGQCTVNQRWSDMQVLHEADGMYIGFSVTQRPQQAKSEARRMLSSLLQTLDTLPRHSHVLVLIHHAELLFEAEDIAPLFSTLEQRDARVFVGMRSIADVGRDALRVLRDAQTLLVHRSATSRPFEQFISPQWWQRGQLEMHVRSLPDDECFVIHKGTSTHVRVFPVQAEHHPPSPGSRTPFHTPSLHQQPSSREHCSDEENELEEILATIFGPSQGSCLSENVYGSLWQHLLSVGVDARSIQDHISLLRSLSFLRTTH